MPHQKGPQRPKIPQKQRQQKKQLDWKPAKESQKICPRPSFLKARKKPRKMLAPRRRHKKEDEKEGGWPSGRIKNRRALAEGQDCRRKSRGTSSEKGTKEQKRKTVENNEGEQKTYVLRYQYLWNKHHRPYRAERAGCLSREPRKGTSRET